MKSVRTFALAALLLSLVNASASAQSEVEATSAPAGIEMMAEGETLDLGSRTISIRQLDIVPFVDTTYSRRYRFDTFDNPKLWQLRNAYELDKVVTPGKTEFEKQKLLMTWVHEQWKFGDPTGLGGLRNAQQILKLARKEQKFFCVQYAATLVSTAASMGWVCRPCGKSNHTWTELWSTEHRKWIWFDPTPNTYVEKNDVPLNTHEIRKAWFENRGQGLETVNAKTGKRTPLRRFNYNVIGFIPNTNWLDAGPNYGKQFVIRDEHTKGREGATREVVKNPDVDPYFPINQAALSLVPEGLNLKVGIKTLTPNFKTFQIRENDGPWSDSAAEFTWKLHEGRNRLEARSVNLFGIGGPVSAVELAVKDTVAGTARAIDGPVVIPAISFVAEGGGRVAIRPKGRQAQAPHVHFWHTPGHWLAWTFDAVASGEYDLHLRYASRFPTRRSVQLNGQIVPGSESVKLDVTGGWTAWRDFRLPTRLKLRAGKNVLRISCLDETSLALSALSLTSPGKPDIGIDARRFSGQGGGEVQSTVSDEHGYFFMWNDTGHWIEWTLAGVPEGTYDAYLHYASLQESPRKAEVNGKVVRGLASFTVPISRGWRIWTEAKLPAPITLTEGRNVIRMTSVGGRGLNLTAIRLSAAGKADIIIPAVGFSSQGGGTVRTISPSRHGSFYHWDDKGHWLEWSLRVPRAGKYRLGFRYATRDRAPRAVLINGRPPEGLESFGLQRTSDWAAWTETELPSPVSLEAGLNTLRLTNTDGGGLNLDEIRVTPVTQE
jgi:Carbohydrate binding module (family 6)/Transglutaminase-like superfamily